MRGRPALSGSDSGRSSPSAPYPPVSQVSGVSNSPFFIRRDASVMPSSIPQHAVSRAVSDVRTAYLGSSGQVGVGASSSASIISSRNRKGYLSDDSPPEVSRPSARAFVEPASNPFPRAAQAHLSNNSRLGDNVLATARSVGVASPIRRRDVSGSSQSVNSSRQSPTTVPALMARQPVNAASFRRGDSPRSVFVPFLVSDAMPPPSKDPSSSRTDRFSGRAMLSCM
jgi:hypothetical protein